MELDREHLFQEVANALAANHGASTGEIAAVAGVSRATLHRVFGSRDELVAVIYGWLLTRCDRIFDAAGVDPAARPSAAGTAPARAPTAGLDPVLDVLERLTDDSYPLAQSLWLLIVTPQLEENPELLARLEIQDLRLEKFFLRGQTEGIFRQDLPPRWLAYSLGSQVMSAWHLVEDGYAGARDVPRLVRAAILDGVLDPGGPVGPGSPDRPAPKGP